jgi:hypothetical protein
MACIYLSSSVFICGSFSVSARGDESPFGINGCTWSHLGMNTDKFDRDTGLKRLRALKEAGVTWDRCDLWWGRIEPEKGKFVWRDVDWIVKQYQEAGINFMPILCYGSEWQKSKAPVTDEERELYARYVYEMVNRYKSAIHVWEIWNEPNITPFWSPTPDVKEYAKLLKVAYAAAKKADPNCTVVGAAVAGVDFDFIKALLDAGGGECMDAISMHPYQGDLGSLSPDKGGLWDHVRGLEKILADHGDRKPIYLTEMGHRTTGTAGHTQVTEFQQAAYMVRSYVIGLAAGADRIFWFNLQDWEEFWGIIRQNFGRKPSFAAYQTMVRNLEGKQPLGTIDLGPGVAAYVFAAPKQPVRPRDAVLIVWSSDDVEHINKLGRKDLRVEIMPQFLPVDEPTLRSLKPLR